jgi:hypothetical protein
MKFAVKTINWPDEVTGLYSAGDLCLPNNKAQFQIGLGKVKYNILGLLTVQQNQAILLLV